MYMEYDIAIIGGLRNKYHELVKLWIGLALI